MKSGISFVLCSRVSVIFDVMSPTHGWLPVAHLIDISKDLRSNLSLEVA